MNYQYPCKTNLLVLILALSLSACKQEVSEKISPPIKRVKTTVVSHEQHQIRYFTGLIEANKTLDMNFRIPGELAKLPIKSWKRVKKGQLLAQLDNSQQLINKKSQQASLKQSKSEYERAKTLIDKNAISQANLDALEANYIHAQAAYEQSLKDIEYTSLIAPFPGVVSNRYVDNYTKVSSSLMILTLEDIEQYKIKITVPQSIFANFKGTDLVEITAEVEGFAQPFPLKIDELSVSKKSSQQLQLTLLMQPPKERRIVTGTSVKVKAEATNDQIYFILPSHTVLKSTQGNYVYVVQSTPEGSFLQKRKVKVAGISQHGIKVSDGLKEGERVVVAGVSQVSDGQQVRVGVE
ncbi:MAG: RND family efflux transporter MFP subunit [Shewanella psychromarinicola]|jgi:RND family efflux transporter MFP subunit|uniref:efflux RND transporter periplasmic adaptor subunit n=1 Tax=Shewanella psychromarinicola TaxID=2487742 RepID=UPI003EEE49B7